jgi:integrase
MRPISDLFELEYRPIRHLSDKAIACYRVSVRHFDRFVQTIPDRVPGPARLADLTDLTVAQFVSVRERATCRATAKRDRTQLLCLWRYACRCGYKGVWPNPTPLRVPERVPRATRAEELDQLLDYFRGISGTIDGVPASAWWGSLIPALFQCGTRIGETLAVEWGAIDWQAHTILFRAETRKAKTRDIVREITPELLAMLEERRRVSGRVWRWDRVYTHLWSHFRRHCAAAGITYRGFHAIRKAACSYTRASGGDATHLADHANSRTTDVYIDPTIAPGESNLARLPLLRSLRRDDLAPEGVRPEEAALRAGWGVGKAVARAGLPRPSRGESDALADEHGCGPLAAWFRHGVAAGWSAAAGPDAEAG